MDEFYSFSATELGGGQALLASFRGQVAVVVNTASQCGFTPQYGGLEALYQKYKDAGLVILGFPCNQFMNQEPGDAGTIRQTCLVRYGVSFPMFDKIDVNGPGAHPLFQWLKKSLPGSFGESIKWNFTKFLIARDGTPLRRYAPMVTPAAMEPDIIQALGRK